MSETKHTFEAEVGRILELVINSLYKDREIFLRELISNASDACDRLRYLSLTEPELLEGDSEFRIDIIADSDAGLVEIRDNGIGMNHDELVANLGTIARSGTARFLEQATGDNKTDMKLIGQFGVGFYSVFMVADQVIVRSRKAGESNGWLWSSDGRSGYSVREADEVPPRGTSVTLHLKTDAKEYLSEWKIRDIVRRYSDHIAFPIFLDVKKKAGDTKTKDEGPEQINTASALWARPKNEITEEQYTEFYRHVAHAFDEPFARVHFTAEGVLSYTALLFIPSSRPFDLYDPKRKHGVKLYVRRVFITDDVEALMPRYLRFVAGIVDSEDLELNVSRETLQHGAVVAKMKKTLVKRLLDELARKAKESPAGESTEETEGAPKARTYEDFWTEFGGVLKEGIYEDPENRDRLLELARFRSTEGPGWTSLEDYVARMKAGQKAIYYITGDSIEALRRNPHLEATRAKGVEVLLLEDAVDEFWVPEVEEYKSQKFASLTRGDVDLSAIADEAKTEAEKAAEKAEEEDQKAEDKPSERDVNLLIAKLKASLGEEVKDVRLSKRLRESAVCLIAEDAGLDMRLERFLKQHSQIGELSKRILEINGDHPLIRRMTRMAQDGSQQHDLDELARLLLDQARIIEGEPIPDPGAFSRRMSTYLARGLAA